MKRIVMLILLLNVFANHNAHSQKKYGYAIVYCKCGPAAPSKSKIYYSPIIELSVVNFEKYLAGIDPQLPQNSVRYYNYAISKWFERLLKERYHLVLNDREKYAQQYIMVVLNEQGDCNEDKTAIGCFYTDKQLLIDQRTNSMNKDRIPEKAEENCEVIDLK